MIQTKIPLLDLTPEIDLLWDELTDAMQRVLRSGRFILGPEVAAFEGEVGKYLGVRRAVGVNSGTDALVIGLKALGIGPGDEVITTPFSFFATAESISNIGARPVFADIEAGSFNIDPKSVEARITPRTRAIIPVHIYGRPAAMDAIMQLAEAHDLKVIEDCAQSFGAWIGGDQQKYTGTIGHIGAFSFFPSKTLGGFGDGGLLVTQDEALADQADMLRKHGARKKYHNEVPGYNSRLDALQAAMLQVKLRYIDQFNTGRRRVAALYNQALADVDDVVTPELVPGHVFHQYTIRILNGKRDQVKARMADAGISTMVYYPIPQDRLPVYAHMDHPPNPVSDQMTEEVLSLPIWPTCGEDVVGYVTDTLSSILQQL